MSRQNDPNFKLVVNKGTGRRAYSCLDCDSDAVYYDKYDTFACIKCDQWLDVCRCGPNDHCPYPKPPAKPSDVKHKHNGYE